MPDAKPWDMEGGTGNRKVVLGRCTATPPALPSGRHQHQRQGWEAGALRSAVLGICCPRVLTDPQALQLVPSPGLIPRCSISSSSSQSWKGQGIVFKEALPCWRFAWCEQSPPPSLQTGLPAMHFPAPSAPTGLGIKYGIVDGSLPCPI